MRHTILALLALTLGACAQAPYTPAPKIAPLNFTPVKQGNKAISQGNKAIGQSAQKVQTQLTTVRASLDSAIAEAAAQKETNAKLDQNLKDASNALNAAITENTSLRMGTYNQQQKIDAQDETIKTLSDDGEAKQKLIDGQTSELTTQRADNANYKAQEKLDQRWWGIGYFIHGIKYLGWHILILLVILAVIGFLLNMFVPFLRPFLMVAANFFAKLPGRLGALIVLLFTKLKPKPKPPAEEPSPGPPPS